jgi:hypothetical protein
MRIFLPGALGQIVPKCFGPAITVTRYLSNFKEPDDLWHYVSNMDPRTWLDDYKYEMETHCVPSHLVARYIPLMMDQTTWVHNLARGSINSWEQMRTTLLGCSGVVRQIPADACKFIHKLCSLLQHIPIDLIICGSLGNDCP